MFASLHTSAVTLGRVQRRGGQGMIARLFALLEISRQRRQLLDLDDALLRDIGLTREQALHEAGRSAFDDGSRPAWDAPVHWLERMGALR